MKRSLLASAATIALVAGASAAFGSDLSGRAPGGLKDGSIGVPVPAPVPHEETYKYYVGIGGGTALYSSGTITASGLGGAGLETVPFGDNYHGVISVVAGRYITPSLRLELGLDFRTSQSVLSGDQVYTTRLYGPGATQNVTNATGTVTLYSGPSQNYNNYNVVQSEDAKAKTHTFMLNLVQDFNRGGRLNPYLGVGVGMAVHMIDRSFRANGVCYEGRNDVLVLYGVDHPTTCWNDEGLPPTVTSSGRTEGIGVGLAASLMAGVSYSLSERTHLDVGYRLMWQGGKVSVAFTNGDGLGTTTLKLGDRLDHEIRTGLRFDIW
jgi:opacity protein-like surface antigen